LSYIGHYLFDRKAESRKIIEIDTIKTVKYYLGRTEWDKSVVYLYNPSAKYYYCAEALREVFYASNEKWFPKKGKHKIRIVTTGCTSYVKGMNVLLLTAKLLVENNIDFEWIVVGNCDRKKEIETHEQLKFSDYNVRFNGYTSADELKQILLSSDMYVHLAYIENSPNSICEAQILGVPVIASYVGGVPCLVHNGEDGILIPSNDPYLAAFNIIGLSGDIDKQLYLSHRAIRVAEMRHNPDSITQDLLNAYRNIINYNK
jgi:glycosyltransferase involved in cell wall biosynthesis